MIYSVAFLMNFMRTTQKIALSDAPHYSQYTHSPVKPQSISYLVKKQKGRPDIFISLP